MSAVARRDGDDKHGVSRYSCLVPKKLTPRQAAFVAQYLIDRNGAQAAIRAGYSARAAKEQAARLLTKVNVRAAVDAGSARIDNRLEITTENIRREYARLAFADASCLMAWGPTGVTLKRSEELSEDDRRAVAEVSQTISAEGGSIRLKMHDKKGALDSLAKHCGMFDEVTRKLPSRKIPSVINLGDDDHAENPETYPDDYTEH